MTSVEINGDVIAEGIIPYVRINHPHREIIRSVNPGCGGFICRPDDIMIDVDFRGREPDTIKRIAVDNFLIDQMTIREGSGMATFRYALIDSIHHTHNPEITRVCFRALRVEIRPPAEGFGWDSSDTHGVRICLECKRNYISYHYVRDAMLNKGFPLKIIDEMWKNKDVFEFLCCSCHKKSEELL